MTLAADVMFVNGIGFFVITSRRINFITLEYLRSCTKYKLNNLIKNVINLYNTSVFKTNNALMERELD